MRRDKNARLEAGPVLTESEKSFKYVLTSLNGQGMLSYVKVI